MQKQFLSVDGFRIAYIELNAMASETVFFVHCNSGSVTNWSYLLQSSLLSSYRLIALDLPGHGSSSHSDRPADDFVPAYTGKIVAAAIKQLAGEGSFCAVGFSYGTNIIAELLPYVQPAGVVLISPSVIGTGCGIERLSLNLDSIYLKETAPVEEAAAFYAQHLVNHAVQQDYMADYYACQKEFRAAILQHAAAGHISDEIALLRDLHIPLLILFGEQDRLLDVNYLDDVPMPLYKDKIFKMKGAGHFIPTDKADVFTVLLHEYLQEVFTPGHSA